jgi:nucleotide-binding universal stress UspA family protein
VIGPLLFCYDGSNGSRAALMAAQDFLSQPPGGYILTVWEPAYLRLARAASFAPAIPDEADVDAEESNYASQAAKEGANVAREHGFHLTPLAERAQDGIAPTILSVADRLGAKLIVCGQRGRGPVRAAIFGSVSHALSSHARVPILIAPENTITTEAS